MKSFSHSHLLLIALLFALPLYGSAQESSSSTIATSSVATSTAPLSKTQLFTLCSQEAIEVRDTKLAQARSTYNSGMNALLSERKEREKESVAVEGEKEKKALIRDSVEAYKNQVRTLQNTLTQSRKTIWQTFEADTKNCRESLDKKIETELKEEKKATKEQAKREVAEMKESAKDVKQEVKKEEVEQKSVKESLFDSIKSLFGKEN